MKKNVTVLAVVAILVMATSAFAVSPNVRISQVYGGGGGTNVLATYSQDYVELFNASSDPVDISGWTVEYGSATGSWGSSGTNIFTFPAASSIGGCSYVMIACGTAGTGGAAFPITPDFNGTLTISSTSGKIALFNAVNTNLACGLELAGTLVDKVAFGTANCAEGTAAGVLTVSSAAVRTFGGAKDTDDNLVDFAVVENAVPRNSATPAGCEVRDELQSWGCIKSIFR